MIKTIPLSKLIPSPRNVRRSSDDEADRQLKADIEARGLLQNLVVSSVKKPRGRFAVEAGGRRLRALQALAREGKLSANHEVDCFVLDDDAAAGTVGSGRISVPSRASTVPSLPSTRRTGARGRRLSAFAHEQPKSIYAWCPFGVDSSRKQTVL